MVRKILGWLIFVLISSFIGFIIWLFFFRTEPQITTFTPVQRSEDFFPVDTTSNIGGTGIVNQEGREGTLGANLIPRVRQLSKVPVAGGISFERDTGLSETFITEEGIEEALTSSITIFRYIERATGHLYETRENTLTQTRLSNTTIPKIYEAEFAPNGENVSLRLLDEIDGDLINTIAATVKSKSTTSQETFRLVADGYALEGPFLNQNIEDVELDDNGLTYVIPNTKGGSLIITSDFEDLKKSVSFESPLREWIIQRINKNTIALTTKADSRLDGFLYFLNKNNRKIEKVIGEIPGLTTLVSPDGKWVVYSLSRGNGIETYAYNRETDNTLTLGINTLPKDKCAFANNNSDVIFCGASNQIERTTYPETWYQGSVSFNDDLWKIDLEKEEYDQLLEDGSDVSQSFDMTNLIVSPDDDHIMFVDKTTLTLWNVDTTIIQR